MTLTRLSFFAKDHSLCLPPRPVSNVNHLLIVSENAAIPYGLSRCHRSSSSAALNRCRPLHRCSPCNGPARRCGQECPAHRRGQQCPAQCPAFTCTRSSQMECAACTPAGLGIRQTAVTLVFCQHSASEVVNLTKWWEFKEFLMSNF